MVTIFRCSWRTLLLAIMKTTGPSGITRLSIYEACGVQERPVTDTGIPKIYSVEVPPKSQLLCCMFFHAVHPCSIV